MTKFLRFEVKIEKAILVLIIFMFFIISAFAFLAPVFPLYITEQIKGGNAGTVGVAIAIYFVVKSVLQLFVARAIDKNHGEVDDLWALIIGTVVSAVVMFLYIFATEIRHVFILQALYGVGDALFVPPFFAIFTRHIDKGAEGFEWALYSSISYGGGSALGGVLGGFLALSLGFTAVFIAASVVAFASAGILFFMRDKILITVPKAVRRIPLDVKKL